MPFNTVGNPVVSGIKPIPGKRKSKTYDKERVCSKSGCGTVLNQYNKGGKEDKPDFCNAHTPIYFPRVRGGNKKAKKGV